MVRPGKNGTSGNPFSMKPWRLLITVYSQARWHSWCLARLCTLSVSLVLSSEIWRRGSNGLPSGVRWWMKIASSTTRLLMDERKDIQPVKACASLSPKVLFRTNVGRKRRGTGWPSLIYKTAGEVKVVSQLYVDHSFGLASVAYGLPDFVLSHFTWGIAEAKCILVTAVCVSVCPSPHSHTTAWTRM